MANIKINLMEKKVKNSPLQGIISSIGVSNLGDEELSLLKGIGLKTIALIIGWGICNYVPEYLRTSKIQELEQQNAALEVEIKNYEQELKATQAVRSEMEKIQAQEAEVSGKLAVVTSLDNDRYRAFKVMDTISLLIPERVWIEKIDFTAKNIDINGSSWELFPINDFVSFLKQSGLFNEVRLKSIVSAQASKITPGVPLHLQTIKRYELTMDLKGSHVGEKTAHADANAATPKKE